MSRAFKHPGNAEGGSADQRPASDGPPAAGEGTFPAGTSPRFGGDAGLVSRLLAGDEAAFTELVGRFHKRLLRLALTFVSDRGAAEEVVQETWLAVLQGLRGFEGRSSLKTWIFRILVNRAKTRGVRDGRMVSFSSLADPEAAPEPAVDPERLTAGGMWRDPPGPWTEETPEGLVLRTEVRALIKEAIDWLPPRQRAVLVLRDVEEMDPEEVCNVLEIGETTQRVLLHRTRSKSRSALERRLQRSG